jgi:hypothetical protein
MVFLAPAFAQEQEFNVRVDDEGYKAFEADNGMAVRWRFEDTDLRMEVSAPTTGWVGIGFDPRVAMRDADFKIGYVAANNVTITDDYGVANGAHRPDQEIGGSNDIIESEGSEQDGRTTIRFLVPAYSNDRFDKIFEEGRTYRILLSYGPNGADDTSTVHAIEAEAIGEITL